MTLAELNQEVAIRALDRAGMESYATEISALDYQEPRLRFNRDEIISIAERCPEGATMQEFKTFITLAMLQGAHPLLNEMWMIKFKSGAGGYYPAAFVTAYKWYEREARNARPDLAFTNPEWYDLKTGKWTDVWPYDPKIQAPYQGRIGVKTADMTDYTWVTLRWDERVKLYKGAPQAEWKNQPIFMMTKCLWKTAAEKFMPPRLAQVITEPEYQPPIEREGAWESDPEKTPAENAIDAGRAGTERREEEKRVRKGDLSGKPTPEQLEEYGGFRAMLDPDIIMKILMRVVGHAKAPKLSSSEMENVLIELRGVDIGESSPDPEQ